MLKIKELLAKMLGQCEFKTLLWENPNPSSAFATQIVSLDLSEYDFVEIIFAYSTSALSDTDTRKAHIGSGGKVLFGVSLTTSGNPYIMSRGFSVANGGVTFEAPYRKQQNASASATTNNTDAIPLRIYGIKFAGGGYFLTELLKSFVTLLKGGVANVKHKEATFENTHAHERNTESSYSCNTIKKLAGKYSNLAYKCSDSCNYASGWLQSNRNNWSIFKFWRIASAYIDKCRWYSYLWLYIKQNDSSNYIGYDNNNPLYQGKPVLIAKGVA